MHEECPQFHQFTGYSIPIQDPMVEWCQEGLQAKLNEPSSLESWRMLLQIDADESVGFDWGDAGRVYFWIREVDLVDLAFERTWMVTQSH